MEMHSATPLVVPSVANIATPGEPKGDPPEAAFDTTPAVALTAIAAYSGPILVDLDETLYLRNSTEDFLDLARPALLAVILLRVVDFVQPWRWSGGDATRDVWRVQLIRWLFPWTMGRWRKEVSRLAKEFTNAPLMEVLKERPQFVVVTIGFAPIVEPLVAAMDLPGTRVIAARPTVFADRRLGKLRSAVKHLGDDVVRSSLVITDSLNDLSLLRHCALGLRTVWPNARYRQAGAAVYFPGMYIAHIKRPGEHYLRRAVLQEDYLLWVLSSIALSAAPIQHLGGLLLLLLSFWVVYEAGYVDNDAVAAKHELQPALTREYHEKTVATPVLPPLLWTLSLAAAGIFLLRFPHQPTVRDGLYWGAALLATFGWFMLYNRSDKPSRVWMYAGLQLSRTAIFVLLVPILPIGAMALAAQVLTRWMPYYIYRLVGRSWPLSAHFGIARVLVFAILAILLAGASGWAILFNWTTLALLLWNLLRARRDIAAVIANYSRVDRSAPHTGPRQ